MEPFLAAVTIFGGNFAPRGWAFCDGQLLPISSNSALFSLIGTMYGGDGRTTFQLPDLRGRVPLGPRTGPGLTPYREGQRSGAEYITLNYLEIPAHTHGAQLSGTMNATLQAGTGKGSSGASGGYFADSNDFDSSPGGGDMAGLTVDTSTLNATLGNTGGNQSHENRQPWLAINYIIATTGTYPSRS